MLPLRFILFFAVVSLAQNVNAAEPHIYAQANTQPDAPKQISTIEPRESEPHFDFYVLALSWSPSFCAATEERASVHVQDQQCATRRLSFVVHGLWPQYERGFPSFCQAPAPSLDGAIVSKMLDLMPSRRLIYYEWERHGTCSGLSAQAYFETVRKARAVVKIPDIYAELEKPITVVPGEVADAFVKVNPGLPRDAVAVTCDKKRLREIRVCLAKDFSFRTCPQIVHRGCRRNMVEMPAVRGR